MDKTRVLVHYDLNKPDRTVLSGALIPISIFTKSHALRPINMIKWRQFDWSTHRADVDQANMGDRVLRDQEHIGVFLAHLSRASTILSLSKQRRRIRFILCTSVSKMKQIKEGIGRRNWALPMTGTMNIMITYNC